MTVPEDAAPEYDCYQNAPLMYHHWYWDGRVWETTTWLGVPTLKSVSDMWNYQEILTELRPSLVVEFGTYMGGSALFFATIMDQLGDDYLVFTVDINRDTIRDEVLTHEHIEVYTASSADDRVRHRLEELRAAHPGSAFVILDSDHREEHVRAELELLLPVLTRGDYLVVEDTNLNGHPVEPGYRPGPHEAVERFLAAHPNEFYQDRRRETKFGFTFAPDAFLVKQ
ncbi:MAG: class I SAM-dependent methyltransferase [Acidobacteriaceae bacterium]|nr:class I SAM-dependent methyltransferase [Acidobacteriaceae bacterium]